MAHDVAFFFCCSSLLRSMLAREQREHKKLALTCQGHHVVVRDGRWEGNGHVGTGPWTMVHYSFAIFAILCEVAPAAVFSLQQCNTSASPYLGEIGVNDTIHTQFLIINGDICVNIFSSAWL
jgi:hypothetical protein